MDLSQMDSTIASRSAHAVILPIFSVLSILVIVVPFITHYHNRSIGACSLILFVTMLNFFTFVNVLLWPDENYDSWWYGYGLCDIEAKLQWPCTTGLAAAVLCITRRLALALDVDNARISTTKRFERRQKIIDLAICFGIPVLQIALHYLIQPNRYYITAVGGCLASFDNSWPTIVIMYIWPVLFSLLNCYYAITVIYLIRQHRSQFAAILSTSSTLTPSRFLRLFIMALTELAIYTPVSIYFFYVNVDIPWLSYDFGAIHDPSTWNIIILLPAWGSRTFDHYVSIVMAFFIFIYFGWSGDAVRVYRRTALACGLGRVWPGLDNVRRPSIQSIGSEKGPLSRLSLVRWLKVYFERHRAESAVGTTFVGIEISSPTKTSPSVALFSQSTSSHSPSVVPISRYSPSTHPSSDLPDFATPNLDPYTSPGRSTGSRVGAKTQLTFPTFPSLFSRSGKTPHISAPMLTESQEEHKPAFETVDLEDAKERFGGAEEKAGFAETKVGGSGEVEN